MTEREWQNQVTQLMTIWGWRWYHTHDSRRSKRGFPDLAAVRERLIIVEVKTDRGRLTIDQAEWIRDLEAAHVEVYVWRPRDWNAVTAALKPVAHQSLQR